MYYLCCQILLSDRRLISDLVIYNQTFQQTIIYRLNLVTSQMVTSDCTSTMSCVSQSIQNKDFRSFPNAQPS